MIRRYILHLEFHKGYKPTISFKRAPYHGQRCVDGGELVILKRCPTCSGVGLLSEKAPPDILEFTADANAEFSLKVGDVVEEYGAHYRVAEGSGTKWLRLVRITTINH